jgi:hypothetical protein
VSLFFATWASTAHEGEAHDDQEKSTPTTVAPRFAAETEQFSLVAISHGEELVVYLDDARANAPVVGAKVEVLAGDVTLQAKETAPAVYRIKSDLFSQPKTHDLVFAITAGSATDLISGQLDLSRPAPAQSERAMAYTEALIIKHTYWIIGGAAGLFAIAFVLFLAGTYRTSGLAATLSVAMLIAVSVSLKMEGPSAGSVTDPVRAQSAHAERPARLADGNLFVPKVTQRLLEIGTLKPAKANVNTAVHHIGEIIPDPNSSGKVQPSINGKIVPPPGGIPYLSQKVRRGQVMAYVVPTFELVDRVEIQEQVGKLDQDIALIQQRLSRLSQLKGTIAQRQIDDTRLELKELRKRRRNIGPTLGKREVLRAPVDGIVSSAHVVAGQVVDAKEVILEIIDPRHLWVRAVAYDESVITEMVGATAIDMKGNQFDLKYIGRGPSLVQQAVPLLFHIETPHGAQSIGEPVKVFIRTRRNSKGLIVPRRAVVKSENGEAQLWEQRKPELFVAHPVTIAPINGETVLIKSGLKAGTRIVDRGAGLLNQIR